MGKQLTDAVSTELGASYGCDISFLADGQVAASSLPRSAAEELLARSEKHGDSYQDVIRIGDASYRAAFEPLIDPGSGADRGHARDSARPGPRQPLSMGSRRARVADDFRRDDRRRVGQLFA